MKGAVEEPFGAQCRTNPLLPSSCSRWRWKHTTGSVAEKQAALLRFVPNHHSFDTKGIILYQQVAVQAGILCPQTPVVFSLFHWNNCWDLSSETDAAFQKKTKTDCLSVDCCYFRQSNIMKEIKTHEEVTIANLKMTAAVREISVDAAVAAFLSGLDVIFTLWEEGRTALKAFLRGKDLFSLLLTGVGQSFDQGCNALVNLAVLPC